MLGLILISLYQHVYFSIRCGSMAVQRYVRRVQAGCFSQKCMYGETPRCRVKLLHARPEANGLHKLCRKQLCMCVLVAQEQVMELVGQWSKSCAQVTGRLLPNCMCVSYLRVVICMFFFFARKSQYINQVSNRKAQKTRKKQQCNLYVYFQKNTERRKESGCEKQQLTKTIVFPVLAVRGSRERPGS